MNALKILAIVGLAFLLTSCDLSQVPALNGGRLSKEDSKAIGAACRHAGRALEDCFTLNPKTHQAGVFEGWREMNDYMASNKIETVAPEIPPKQLKNKTEEPTVGDKNLPEAKPSMHAVHGESLTTKPAALAGSESQRWSPRPSGNSGNTAHSGPIGTNGNPPQTSVATAATPAPAPAISVAPHPEPASEPTPLPATAQAQPPAPQPKSRPWERRTPGAQSAPGKADPKNHT